jgi:hypothetical protein
VRVCTKVLSGVLPLWVFVFSKEVRFGSYARENTLPPAAVVASRAMIAVLCALVCVRAFPATVLCILVSTLAVCACSCVCVCARAKELVWV